MLFSQCTRIFLAPNIDAPAFKPGNKGGGYFQLFIAKNGSKLAALFAIYPKWKQFFVNEKSQ
jgi:hypothetical protein